MTSGARDEDKYTLEYFTSGERADDEPPFKYRTFYLDDALAEAWRILHGGGESLCIKRSGEHAFDEESLRKAVERISQLRDEKPSHDERELAALVLAETNEGETGDESSHGAGA